MKSNTIIILVATLVVAAGAYWYFFVDSGNEEPLTISETTNIKQAEFEHLLGQLPANFDTSIFSDARFSVLVDITTEIADESFGKDDPFSPISGTSKANQ